MHFNVKDLVINVAGISLLKNMNSEIYDPFEEIPYKPPKKKDFLAEDKHLIYLEFKKRFEDMFKKVLNTHNFVDFEKISQFINSGVDDESFIPTCLLVNSIFKQII